MTPPDPTPRVLHVEDDDNDADLVTLALDRASPKWRSRVDYTRVRDFAEGIGALANERPHLILLDINLPGRSGHELLIQIKSRAATKHIPVVILSNSADRSEIVDCYRDQASAYLTKPSSFSELVEMMGLLDDFWLRITRLPRCGR